MLRLRCTVIIVRSEGLLQKMQQPFFTLFVVRQILIFRNYTQKRKSMSFRGSAATVGILWYATGYSLMLLNIENSKCTMLIGRYRIVLRCRRLPRAFGPRNDGEKSGSVTP